MDDRCRICGNAENNLVHAAREMMFGTRDPFDYLECESCGTIQIADVPDLSKHYPQNYFSFDSASKVDLAATLPRRIAARFAGKYLLNGKSLLGKRIIEWKPWIKFHWPSFLNNSLKLNFDSRILDFGCGDGLLLQNLHYFGFRNLTGADTFIKSDIFYPSGVKILKRSLNELKPNFDLIILQHSFEHLPEPAEALNQLYHLLDSNGCCIVCMPVVNFAWVKYGVDWVQLDPPRHLFLFTEKSFGLIAEKAGFTIHKVRYDSTAFQFWGSEQYARDIPLYDPRSLNISKADSIFSSDQIEEWERLAEQLNFEKKGDQACFYLKKK